MIKEEYKFSEITEKIIGCAMKAHNMLGNGFSRPEGFLRKGMPSAQEVIYQRALAIEMGKADIEFVRELEIPILYDGQEN